jgi:adenylate cyclase
VLEIERKFLVLDTRFLDNVKKKYRIVQGYLSSVPQSTVRVRIKADKAFITIKGIGTNNNTTRFEWEKEINLQEAESLLQLCEKGMIDKTRYEVEFSNHLFEIDVFGGENSGLIVAEIELKHENEFFEKPSWLGEEVTQDKRYFNAYLSNFPFKTWDK